MPSPPPPSSRDEVAQPEVLQQTLHPADFGSSETWHSWWEVNPARSAATGARAATGAQPQDQPQVQPQAATAPVGCQEQPLAVVAQSDPIGYSLASAFSSVRPEATSRTCGPLELAELAMLAAETPEEFAQAQAMDFATLAEALVAFEHRQPLAATGAPATGGPATGAPASLAATGAPATGGPAVPPTPQPAVPPMPPEFAVLFPVSRNGINYPYYDEAARTWIPPPPVRQLGVTLPTLVGRDLSGDVIPEEYLFLDHEDLSPW